MPVYRVQSVQSFSVEGDALDVFSDGSHVEGFTEDSCQDALLENCQTHPLWASAVRMSLHSCVCGYGALRFSHSACEVQCHCLLASGGGLCGLYGVCNPVRVGSFKVLHPQDSTFLRSDQLVSTNHCLVVNPWTLIIIQQ